MTTEKKDEASEMDGMLDLTGSAETKESEVEDNPKEELKKDEEPQKEEETKPEEEVEKAEEEKLEEKEAAEKELSPELKKLNEDNQRLREQLNDLARKTGGLPQEVREQPTEAKEELKKEGEEVKFLSDEEADGLLDDPKKLNTILNRVFQAGREQVMREMPTLVRQQTLSEMTLQQKTQKFWTENKDLDPFKDFVGMVANQVEVDHPDWDYGKIFDKTAEVARERLNLPTSGSEQPKEKKEEVVDLKPALPTGQRGARRVVEEVAKTPEQKEMDELFKFAENNSPS